VDDTTRKSDHEPSESADTEPPARPHDPNQFGPIPVIRPDAPPPDLPEPEVVAPELPHWTEPPTGEVPRVIGGEGDDDLAVWSTLTSATPRWRGQASDWDDGDLTGFGDDLASVGMPDPDADDGGGFFTFDDTAAPPDRRLVPGEPADPHAEPLLDAGAAPAAGRNLPVAIGVGVGLAAAALVLFNIGPAAALGLVVVLLVLAAAELFASLRRVGYHPATLVGLAATATLPLAAYWRGDAALPLGLTLTLVVGLLWWLSGAGTGRVVPNLGATLLGVAWVALLGSYAALLLRSPDGIGLLLAAIIGTVAYDVGGFAVGRVMGRAPLSAASPNKTVEGTIGGGLAAIVVTVLVTARIEPFTQVGDALLLGLVIALVAPLGDLSESLVKRDLGIKDMGTILPGHGGLLDRFDALLFALPATYYLARVVL